MKKHYVVTVKTPSDWETIHKLLIRDETLEDNIPVGSCECTDLQEQNNDRATYLLDDAEVDLLKSNDKIKYVELDTHFHPKTLSERQLKLLELRRALVKFSSTSKVYRQAKDSSDGISPPGSFTHGQAPTPYTTVDVSEKDRVPYSITRAQDYSDDFAYDDPAITEPRPTFASYSENYKEFYPSNYAEWYTQKSIKRPSEVKNVNVQYENDGSDIDIVIVDDGVWLGHPEFVNPDGTRQVKDIIIDGPYHIDPDAFAPGNPHGHTTTTVMGVTTPTDASAKLWWTNSSKRSAQFASIGTLNDAGLSEDYTLTGVNGSDTAYANVYSDSATHGTSCAGVAYGNAFGHAFNSNKWTIYYSGYDGGTLISQVNMYTALKLFHKHKPVNNAYGNKNPTLLNFSIQAPVLVFYYGLDYVTFNTTSSWSWKWRSSTGSFTAIDISNQGTPGALNSVPPFLRTSPYLTFFEDNGLGLVGSFNGETSLIETLQVKSAMEDLIQEPGVFAFVASGNQNQKIVNYNDGIDDDYNNWVSPDGGTTKYYCNRGWFVDLLQTASNESPVFAVGATDANKVLDANDSLYKERLTFFSARGSRIDIYAPGDDVLTAAGEPDTDAKSGPHFYPRYDGNSNGSVGTTKAYASLGVDAYDSRFNGTSCATPIACGWFATILQNRRNWTPFKLKSYIKNSILNQSSSTFYYGIESTSGTDTNHYDLHTLEGGEAKVLYNAAVPSISITSQPQEQTVTAGNLVTLSVTATEDLITGTLSYQWEKAQSTNTSAFTTIFGANSDEYQFTSSINDNGDVYRCVINGTRGVDEITSNEVVLSVLEAPVEPLPVKTYLNAIDWTVLMGIKPKQYLYNRFGSEIYNKKEIFPKSFSIFSQEDCEIKIIRQKACPEFAYTHQEGYRWSLLPESRRIKAKFNVNNFNINESALGITTADATSHTATLAYAGASEGSWRSPNDSANYTVAGSEVLRVVGDDLFQLAVTGKNLSGVNSVFKLQRIDGGGYLSSRDPVADVENVYLPFTYAPVGDYLTGYEVELDYYRRDQTLLSSIDIISDEFFIFWTGGDRGGIDSTHRSTVRIGFVWPDVSNPSSLIHTSRGGDAWGIETPGDVGGEFVSYDEQKFYEGIPVDFVNDYGDNTLYVETNTELNINTYNLEVNEYDTFDGFWDLGEISVPGVEGGECHGLGCKAGRELREAEIVVYEEDQGDGSFANVYYLQDLSPWPSPGKPYSITITQGVNVVTIQVDNPVTKVVGDAIVYLLPIGTPQPPTGLAEGDAEVTYNIIYIATIDKQSKVRSILTSWIAPGDLPYIRVFMQGRQGASMGGMWIGQKTPNGIVLDPFTPHRSSVNIKDSGSESHGESFPSAETDGAIKVINTYTQADSFGKSTAPTNNIGTDTLDTYKSIHSNPRKCGSFLSAGGTNAAGILTPTDYPIRWLTSQSSGLPLATFYVSKNESVEISLEEIFNVDAESVVNSDDANLATIFIARSLNNHSPTGSEKEIYMTLNYDEQ